MNKESHKPSLMVETWEVAAPFMRVHEVPRNARYLLAFASNMRLHGINIYKAFDNQEIAQALQCSYQSLMRSKRILKDKKLLFYDGRPGDYQFILDRWKQTNRGGDEWSHGL